MALYLGIDTSNYTTSVAITDDKQNLIADKRLLLNVKTGGLGLRQSEAVFQHIKNFPLLFANLFDKVDKKSINTIGVSVKPRPEENSYMPVFLVGLTIAQVLAKTLDIPLIETTHQEGHLMAGIWSCGQKLIRDFNAIHISGGTTEVLKVSLKEYRPVKFFIDKIGGTSDLHAGQFIDRVGVKMGLSFPAGPQLEELAQKSIKPCNFPISVNNLNFSFSGPESHAQRLISKGENYSDIARGVENCLINTLEKLIINVYDKNNLKYFLFVGGVARNKYIRTTLKEKLENTTDLKLLFADPVFSSDNAVGASLIAKTGHGGVY